MPGQLKTTSTKKVPVSAYAVARPMMVSVGRQRVAQRQHPPDLPLPQAVRPRGEDVVLVERVEHGGAGHPGDQAQRVRRQRHRREHQVLAARRRGHPVAGEEACRASGNPVTCAIGLVYFIVLLNWPVAGSRPSRPTKRNWSSRPSQNAGIETPADRQHPDGAVQRSPGPSRGEHARAPRRPRGARSMAAKISSRVGGSRSPELREHRLLGRQRVAPVPGEQVPHVAEVLDRQRLVEAELLADPGELLGPGLRSGVDDRRVAGHAPGSARRSRG